MNLMNIGNTWTMDIKLFVLCANLGHYFIYSNYILRFFNVMQAKL